MKRIAYIDGLRGIAIILVILFHAFAQRDWVKILPYKNTYANIIFKSGYLGVQLFFLISGFVILMTLERSRSFGSFAYKRWIRLFPSMLICSILIYITAQWLTHRPMGMPQVSSLAPGLLFTNPSIINTLFRTSVSALEGSFWSLYLEVIFYILFGGMFFLWGRILFFKFNYLISEEYNFLSRIISRLFSEFSSKEFILFLAGSFAYLFYKERYHSSTEISNSLAEINNPPIGRDKKERKKERKATFVIFSFQ